MNVKRQDYLLFSTFYLVQEKRSLPPVDIRVRCYEFSKSVVRFVGRCDINRPYFSLIDQLIRSATSIGANIIEAKAGSSRKDFSRFYTIALKSANETKYWLCLIRDTMDVSKPEIRVLLNEANEISKIIAKSILTLKQT